ncbi:hypothetical protein EDB19DRAFT_2040201 [Suillus lakei]|nr:hypothetical protein EDB19DRAFT_2040201 [Suillus lakei]
MHVCLLPADTLLNIFTTIHEDYDSPISRATLAAFARTCRTFKEPALDTLWKHIDGFESLISCFPEGVSNRDVQGKLTLIRPPFAREWSIFVQHAHRVRSFSFNPSKSDVIDDRVVQALISAPSPTLLPNLRTLQWRDDQECFIPLLRCLLVPTIRSITLGSRLLRTSWAPSFAKSALLTSLGTRCPSVREFVCVYSEDSSDVISDAVCGLRKLSHLDAGVLNTQAFLHLASLSSLKSLSFRTYNIDSIQTNVTPTFVSQINLVHIVVLDIDLDPSGLPYDLLVVPELIISFSECFSPAFEHLNVSFGLDFLFLKCEEILADRRFALAFNVVAPLLSLSCLTELNLGFALQRSMMRHSREWRKPGRCSRKSALEVGAVGLVHLIQHCRDLRAIDMTFCAYSVDIKNEPFSQTIPNENITRLFVGMSPIVDPITVACQLHTLLPKLTAVDRFEWLEDMRLAPQFRSFEEDWAKVDEFLMVLTTGARMRENVGQAT